MKHHPKQSAFTLVELAIVLVIIGLIVGGVLVGRDLIRIAQLQAVISEKERITAALFTFRAKYNALAGDMSNAHQYFGDDCGTNTNDINTGCNGNGDGFIRWNVTNNGEYFTVWEHLARAGLIAGGFDGTGALDSGLLVASETNIPPSKISSSFWVMGEVTCDGCGFGTPVLQPNHVLLSLGSLYPTPYSGNSEWITTSSNLSNSDVAWIDRKLDDGASLTGIMRGGNANGTCGDGQSGDPNDYYDVKHMGADTLNQCVPTFLIQ